MISKKELQYVSSYPRAVPFPGKNYAINVMEYLKKCLETYAIYLVLTIKG